jgi:hypothetical protein
MIVLTGVRAIVRVARIRDRDQPRACGLESRAGTGQG